jgi:hypothetical protein
MASNETTQTELPEWAQGLLGVDTLDNPPTFKSGIWKVAAALPEDLKELEGVTDPLLLLLSGADMQRRLEERMGALVAMARNQGRSWTEVGRALGVSKQTAWQRYAQTARDQEPPVGPNRA